MSPLALGALEWLVGGLATEVGGSPVLLRWSPSSKPTDGRLGFAAGSDAPRYVLLPPLVPAIDAGGAWRRVAGFLLGVVFLVVAHRLTPHLELLHDREGPGSRLGRVRRFAFAVTIHNFREGFAVGWGSW